MSSKSLNEHVGHAERLAEALQKMGQLADHLASTLVGPLPEEASTNKAMFAPAGPGLLGDLGAQLEAMDRACMRVASGLARIGYAVKQKANAVEKEEFNE